MEFYQFHPTAFSLPGAPRFLLSEALRGEGAYLRNDQASASWSATTRCSSSLRAMWWPAPSPAKASAKDGSWPRPVYLDMRHVHDLDLHKRFPGISAFLARYGLDLARDLIPVRPAAHYLMGGIRTDLAGRTNLSGLYAAGEAACTGVHGANRLASNSLLKAWSSARAPPSPCSPTTTRSKPSMPRNMQPEPLTPAEEEQVED